MRQEVIVEAQDDPAIYGKTPALSPKTAEPGELGKTAERDAIKSSKQQLDNIETDRDTLAAQNWLKWNPQENRLYKNDAARSEVQHEEQRGEDKFSHNGVSITVTRGLAIPKITTQGQAYILVGEAIKAIKADTVRFNPPKNIEAAKKYIEGFVNAGVTKLKFKQPVTHSEPWNQEQLRALEIYFAEKLEETSRLASLPLDLPQNRAKKERIAGRIERRGSGIWHKGPSVHGALKHPLKPPKRHTPPPIIR